VFTCALPYRSFHGENTSISAQNAWGGPPALTDSGAWDLSGLDFGCFRFGSVCIDRELGHGNSPVVAQ
jgi:hypothetical protein